MTPARSVRRLACAASGQLVAAGTAEAPRLLLEESEYSALSGSAAAEYSFALECGLDLRVLDFAAPSGALSDKLPRRTDGQASLPELPEGFFLCALRSILASTGPDAYAAAIRACHLAQWRRRTRYCPHCSGALKERETELAMECPSCGLIEFPRISPAVITLVEHKGRIALARNASFANGMHSLIAGFVEAGESLEETVAREIREEIGIEVGDIRYFGSQCWPFPDSMMIGFRAQALGTDIVPDGVEILEAGWFGPDDLPPIPRHGSIARALIDHWLSERGLRTL